MAQPGAWDVVSSAPAAAPVAGGWNVVSTQPVGPARPAGLPAGMNLPGYQPAPLPTMTPVATPQTIRALVDQASHHVAQRGENPMVTQAAKFGAGVIANTAGVVAHPVEAAKGFVRSITPDTDPATGRPTLAGMGEAALGPGGAMLAHLAQSAYRDPAETAGGLVGGALTGEALAPVVRLPGEMAARVPGAVRGVLAPGLDEPLAGTADLTPRARYQAAKNVGVQLDAADAVGSGPLAIAKKINRDSLLGAPIYDRAAAANTAALRGATDSTLEGMSPHEPAQGGAVIQKALKSNMSDLRSGADEQFQNLDDATGGQPVPGAGDVGAAAQAILKRETPFYAKYPSLQPTKAMSVMSDLGKVGDTASYGELQRLRSNAHEFTTSNPDLVKDQSTSWLQQMTGHLDNAITSKGLTPEQSAIFRDANAKWSDMKAHYDDPSSPLYHAVRTPNASKLASGFGEKTPEMVQDLKPRLGPEAMGALRRGVTTDALGVTSGNDYNFNGFGKKLFGMPDAYRDSLYTPEQSGRLTDIANTANTIGKDFNPSGSGKQIQKIGEGLDMARMAQRHLDGIVPLLQYPLAKLINSPRFADWLMEHPGEAAPGGAAPPPLVPPVVGGGDQAPAVAAPNPGAQLIRNKEVVPADAARGVQPVTLPVTKPAAAALPMEWKPAQDTLYHGTGRGMELGAGEGGRWLTDNRDLASTFGPNVEQHSAAGLKIFDANSAAGYKHAMSLAGDADGGPEHFSDFEAPEWKKVADGLRKQGYSAINIGEQHMDGANDIWAFDRGAATPAAAAGSRIAGLDGSATTLHTPTSEIPAKYRVVEADSLVPSHNAQTFKPTEGYPAGVQERDYAGQKENQLRVIQNAQAYKPALTISDNPDGVNGPPVVTPNGTVLGGNSRVMSTQRLYGGDGSPYKNYLKSKASQFGVTADQVDGMKKPVLVREIDSQGGPDELRKLGSALNKPMTGSLGSTERAVSMGKSVSPDTLHQVRAMLDQVGDGATLRDVLSDPSRSNAFLRMMQKDGVITDAERPQYVDPKTGGMTLDGKQAFERSLLGSAIGDSSLMDAAPAHVLAKLNSSIGPIAGLAARTDEWNILPELRRAIQDHGKMAAAGLGVDDFLKQRNVFDHPTTAMEEHLTRVLAENPNVVRDGFAQYGKDSNYAAPGQASFGAPSAREAFNHAFGAKITPEQFADR